MQVVIIDDASTVPAGSEFPGGQFEALTAIIVVRLRRNLGHQKAICVGLVYVYDTYPNAITIIMDGDGEDRPVDIPRLLSEFYSHNCQKIIFARRARRTESLTFKIFYLLYKGVHRILTGVRVMVGNFSIVPYSCLSSLVVISEVWSHYAAAVFNAGLPYDTLAAPRGRRLSGQSRMSFVSLVTHGLSAISVYSARVGVRLLTMSMVAILLLIIAIVLVVFMRLHTTLSLSGWATTVTGLLLIMLLDVIAISFLIVFVILSGRSGALFLPIRDCPHFIGRVTRADTVGDAL